MSENSFLDLVVFLDGKDGKRLPKTIGWCKSDNGKMRGRIDVIPVRGWDGSFVIEERREQGQRPQQGAPAPAQQSNAGGGGAGPRRAPTPTRNDDDIPF